MPAYQTPRTPRPHLVPARHRLRLRAVALAAFVLAALPAAAGPLNTPLQEPDRAFLGIRMQAGSGVGIFVASVVAGSAAARSGIQPGDLIVGVGPNTVRYPNQLMERLAELEPGDRADIGVLRGVEEQRFGVELGRRPGRVRIDLDGVFTMVSPKKRGEVEGTLHLDGLGELSEIYLCQAENCRFSGDDPVWYRPDCIGRGCPAFEIGYYDRPMLGVQLAGRQELLDRYPDGDVAGVLVKEVFTGSPADEAGIEPGDVIVSIDDDVIASARDLRRKLDATVGGVMEADIKRDAGELFRLRVHVPDTGR